MGMVRLCISLTLLAFATATDVRNGTELAKADRSVSDGAVLVQNMLVKEHGVLPKKDEKKGPLVDEQTWRASVATFCLGILELVLIYVGGEKLSEAMMDSKEKTKPMPKDYIIKCQIMTACETCYTNALAACSPVEKTWAAVAAVAANTPAADPKEKQ